MSTDDLVRRARDWARVLPEHIGEPVPALLSELADTIDVLLGDDNANVQTANVVAQIRAENKRLADEVDRLRARNATLSETRTRLLAKHPHVGCDMVREEVEAERDAARAALERVRAIVKGYYVLPYEAHVVIKEIHTELEES